jgi:hypothetical protein
VKFHPIFYILVGIKVSMLNWTRNKGPLVDFQDFFHLPFTLLQKGAILFLED